MEIDPNQKDSEGDSKQLPPLAFWRVKNKAQPIIAAETEGKKSVKKETNFSSKDLNQILSSYCTSFLLAKNQFQVSEILKQIIAKIGVSQIACYGQRKPDKDLFQLIYANSSDKQDAKPYSSKEITFPKKITTERKLWRLITTSKNNNFFNIPGQYRIGKNIVALKYLTNKKCASVVVFQSEETQGLKLNNDLAAWLLSTITKTLDRLNNQQHLTLDRSAANYLLKQTIEAFAQMNSKGQWTYFNRPLLYRLGYEESNVVLDNVFGNKDIVAKKDWDKICKQLALCHDQQIEQDCEYLVKTPQGGWRTLSTLLYPVNKKGITIVNAVSVDITESKRLETQAIKQSELEKWLQEQNRILFNQRDKSGADAVLNALGNHFGFSRCHIGIPRNGKYYIFSQWQCRTLQPILNSQVINTNFDKPYDEIFIDNLDRSLSSENGLAVSRQAVAAMIVPIGSNESQLGILVCESDANHHWDDLEKRAARMICDTLAMGLSQENIHRKLKASRQQFQMAMNAASYGLWEMNIPEQRTYVSSSYFAMLGYTQTTENEYRDINVDNVHIDDKHTVINNGKNLAAGIITEVNYESRHIAQDGSIKWILTRGRVIKWDETGNPLRAMGTVSDITDLKKPQTDLQLAYQQAEAARIAKGEFLARMSHEIRTPMNAIIGMSYMLLKSELNPQQRHYIDDIDKAAKSLLQIIDDILDFSKIEAGKLDIENHNFNIRKHTERVCHRYFNLAHEKGLSFSVHIDPSVPHLLQADSTRIRQVLINLLNNAFKFTNRGSVSVDVVCISKEDKVRLIEFKVEDTGIGLSEEKISSLFDPFTQADGSRTRQYGGTGLGLAISKLLVEKMEGKVNVQSHINQGSVFSFTVKCRATTRKSKNDQTQIQHDKRIDGHSNTTSPALGKLRILLAEDNKVNQKVAVGMLRHLGADTTIANNGTEAVYIMKACQAGEFDLILMDIEMPYMGGFEATAAIRRIIRHKSVPIIAMTAHIVDGQLQRYLDSGMNDCISKPISPPDLEQVLQSNSPVRALSARSGDQLH